jgi:hypothetical protein
MGPIIALRFGRGDNVDALGMMWVVMMDLILPVRPPARFR